MADQEYDRALILFEKAVALAGQIGAEMIAATAAKNAGECLINLGELDRGRAMLQRAADTLQRLGVIGLQQAALGQLGMARAAQGICRVPSSTGARRSISRAPTGPARGSDLGPERGRGSYPARRLGKGAAAQRRGRSQGEGTPGHRAMLGALLNDARIAARTGNLPRAEQLIDELPRPAPASCDCCAGRPRPRWPR